MSHSRGRPPLPHAAPSSEPLHTGTPKPRAERRGRWHAGLTCDGALAGIPCGHSADTVWGEGDLITTILDEDSVAACHVWHVGHRVSTVMVVLDVCLLGLALRVLCSRVQGRTVGPSSPWPGIPSGPLRGSSVKHCCCRVSHHGPKQLPASSTVLYFPMGKVHKGSPQMPSPPRLSHVDRHSQETWHPSCFIPTNTSQPQSSTPGPAPAVGRAPLKDPRVPALYLALENVTGRKAEALRALVTSEVSKYMCGGSLGL